MDQKKWLDSLTSLLIGTLASLTLLALLSLFMLWAIGRPVQAAPENPADPTPTVYVPSAGVPPATEVPPTATPVPPTAVPPTPAPPTIVANTDGVNVRSGPSIVFAVVDFLAPGAEAQVIGRYADWWQIETPGAPGWVESNCVESATMPLQAQEHVLEIEEWTNTNDSNDPDYPPIGRTCFNVTVMQP